jgi:hypothetical protein
VIFSGISILLSLLLAVGLSYIALTLNIANL